MCETLLNVTNATVMFTNGRLHGSVATYTCNGGYVASPSSTRRCSGTTWSGDTITCVGMYSNVWLCSGDAPAPLHKHLTVVSESIHCLVTSSERTTTTTITTVKSIFYLMFMICVNVCSYNVRDLIKCYQCNCDVH